MHATVSGALSRAERIVTPAMSAVGIVATTCAATDCSSAGKGIEVRRSAPKRSTATAISSLSY